MYFTKPQGLLMGLKRMHMTKMNRLYIARTLKEDQHLRLLLNLLLYHFNGSEPTYKSQRINLLDVIASCNQLNENALNKILMTVFSEGKSHRLYLI